MAIDHPPFAMSTKIKWQREFSKKLITPFRVKNLSHMRTICTEPHRYPLSCHSQTISTLFILPMPFPPAWWKATTRISKTVNIAICCDFIVSHRLNRFLRASWLYHWVYWQTLLRYFAMFQFRYVCSWYMRLFSVKRTNIFRWIRMILHTHKWGLDNSDNMNILFGHGYELTL